jgi:hypothetical protein
MLPQILLHQRRSQGKIPSLLGLNVNIQKKAGEKMVKASAFSLLAVDFRTPYL